MSLANRGAEFSRKIRDDPLKRNVILLKFLLQCAGLWPETESKIIQLFGYLNISSFMLLSLQQLYSIYKNINNVPLIYRLISTNATMFQGVVKMLILVVYKKELRNIIVTIWFDFLPVTAATKYKQIKIRNAGNNTSVIIYVCCIFTWLGSFQYFSFHFIAGSRDFPIPTAFSLNHNFIYELFYLWQYFTAGFVSLAVLSLDLLFVTLILTCVGQLQIINSNLELFGASNDDEKINFIGHFRKLKILLINELFDELLLRKFIQQHLVVTETYYNIQKSFRFLMLVQLLTSALTIGISLFTLTKYRDQILVYAISPAIVIMLLFCYCWFGNELIEAGNGTNAAAYSSSWYLAETRLQKNLILIIRRANEEMALTAAGLTKMNRNTLIQVFKFAMSMYTLFGSLTESD